MFDRYVKGLKVLGLRVDRHKTGTSEELDFLMYPDIGEIGRDVYFALAYFFVLCKDQNSCFLFDDLARKVYQRKGGKNGQAKDDGKVESDASLKWQKMYDDAVLKQYNLYKGKFPSAAGDEDLANVSFLELCSFV